MPVIKSLKNPLTFSDEHNQYTTGSINVSKIVSDITESILSTNPNIVIGANDENEKTAILKSEILKLLDKDIYFDSKGREDLIKRIFDFIFGYGELQKFVDDEDISDIDGTAYNEFSIKRKGVREKINVSFNNNDTFETYCKLIAIRNGGILNENDSHSRVADLKNRLRINVSIPPRNIKGPAISIRKHRKESYTIDDLIYEKMLDNDSSQLLTEYIRGNKSMMFCGKGASGKTTLLRALINHIDEMERVLIVESDAEIYADKKYCIEQRVKRDSEGGNAITLEMLIKDGLTMSLDTYCIGEITGTEAYDFIKASCTGHRVLATIHADSAADCISRLVSLASTSKTIESEDNLYKMARNGIEVIVYLKNFSVKEIILIHPEAKELEVSYERK
ncbi:MAG: CpaF family protein [Clostridia bacterium]|nr:CpaF family protein [Clostridia bacterium]